MFGDSDMANMYGDEISPVCVRLFCWRFLSGACVAATALISVLMRLHDSTVLVVVAVDNGA